MQSNSALELQKNVITGRQHSSQRTLVTMKKITCRITSEKRLSALKNFPIAKLSMLLSPIGPLTGFSKI